MLTNVWNDFWKYCSSSKIFWGLMVLSLFLMYSEAHGVGDKLVLTTNILLLAVIGGFFISWTFKVAPIKGNRILIIVAYVSLSVLCMILGPKFFYEAVGVYIFDQDSCDSFDCIIEKMSSSHSFFTVIVLSAQMYFLKIFYVKIIEN